MITGNQPLDYFIMQSAENRDEVMKAFNQSSERYINNILIDYKLDSKDFTDADWKIISQYLGDERYGW